MKKQKLWLLAMAALVAPALVVPACAELTAIDKQYIEQLIKGGPSTLRQVAENMYNTSYRIPKCSTSWPRSCSRSIR